MSDPGQPVRPRQRRQALHFCAALAPVLMVLAAPGCASGPKQSLNVLQAADTEPAATLRNTPGGMLDFDMPTHVTELDGKAVKYKRVLLDYGWSQPLRVPAGNHLVEVVMDGAGAKYFVTFRYTFLADHTYRVKHAGGFDARVRLLDETAGTSTVVGPRKL
jgi:hypothetical protein